MLKIAIDTGGTFTDYTSIGSINDGDEKQIFIKNPTNHNNPSRGIIDGLKELSKKWNVDIKTLLSNTSQISHGTTLALNALIEKKGVKTALFTTEGFRDALELRRSQLDNQWDIHAKTPPLLVKRRLRLGITERVDYKGSIIKQLDEDNVRRACKICKEQNIKSIAVCYLFSFLNPKHERRTREIINEELPDVFVSLSSDVSAQIREYERTTTTVINAYVTPIISSYLNDLKVELSKYGWNKTIKIMMNSGGLSDIVTMNKLGVKTLLSGPAGGGVGNYNLSHLLNKNKLLLGDMGGTSFDLHIIKDKQQLISESKIESYPITLPMMDIHSIGAGGGSIISIDDSGAVHVGPESAGSTPGPACYDKGGNKATITDALLVLNLIDENNFLGGRLKLSRKRAEEVMYDEVAKKLNITTKEAALIVYKVASELMADSLRLITMHEGHDPREYSLVGGGGAFGLFACNIMDSLKMNEVLIPVQGPVFCSWGILGAKRRYDITKSFFMEKSRFNYEKINDVIEDMINTSNIELDNLEVAEDNRQFELIFEMRYIGQHHELSIPMDRLHFNQNDIDYIDELFHKTHNDVYQYSQKENDWEIINIHLAAFEDVVENPLFTISEDKNIIKTGKTKEIGLYDEEVNLYSQTDINQDIYGPALIEFDYTSVLIPCGYKSQLLDDGILSIKKIEGDINEH